MWRKPGEKTEKKLEEEEEWQELSTAPVGILELVIFGKKIFCIFFLFCCSLNLPQVSTTFLLYLEWCWPSVVELGGQS